MAIDRRAFSIAALHTWNSASKCCIIRPHRSTTYVDAAYCYRPSRVVCLPVCLSVCHTIEPRKMASPIEMPCWLRTRVGPRNHLLDGGPDPPWEVVILRGKGRPL